MYSDFLFGSRLGPIFLWRGVFSDQNQVNKTAFMKFKAKAELKCLIEPALELCE